MNNAQYGTAGKQSIVSKIFDQPVNHQNNRNNDGYRMGTSLSELKNKRMQMMKQREIPKNIPPTSHMPVKKQSDINSLVKDINKDLDNMGPSLRTDDNESVSELIEEFEDTKKKPTKYFYHIKRTGYELLLIVFIYVLLSQNFMRTMIGKYISYINPDENGNIPFLGFIIYGLILGVLFIFFKLILIK